MIKVTLRSFTDDGLNVLLRTKNTRLSYDDDPAGWTPEKRAEHLEYMLNTIKSSWEFLDFTFLIEGVTRAFTHEFVRHRHGSYAQQSMRVVDARNAEVAMPESIAKMEESDTQRCDWDHAVSTSKYIYGRLVDHGIPTQDARGLLPTAVTTAIMAKFNLRSLHEMSKIRLCTRAAKEFQDVLRAMRECVVFHYPWAAPMMQPQCVADGTCAFPKYGKTECPVYDPGLDHAALKAHLGRKFWSLRHEATPRAEGGMALKSDQRNPGENVT